MWGFLKRDAFSQHKDETLDEQLADIPEDMRALATAGESCDQLGFSASLFGELANPIPVNGPGGEIKYINRLLCPCGKCLIGHRLGTLKLIGADNVYDVYETVCSEGRHWSVWYFDMYHPRRSRIAPSGYKFAEFHPRFRTYLALTTNRYCEDFPHAMRTFPSQLGLGDTFGKVIIDKIGYKLLDRAAFLRPPEHQNKLNVLVHVVQFSGGLKDSARQVGRDRMPASGAVRP